MTRKSILMTLSLLGSAVMAMAGTVRNPISTLAAYEPSTEPLITVVNNNASENQLTSNCTWGSPSDDNWPYMNMDCYLAALIDGDTETFWHGWANDENYNIHTHDMWLQVDLKRDDITTFYFEFNRRWDRYGDVALGRGDNPSIIEIRASNDGENWTNITTISEGIYTKNNEFDEMWPYMSSPINMGAAYRYIRFIVRQTDTGNNWFDISEFQLYEALPIEDNQRSLNNLIDSIMGLSLEFPAGANPGQYPAELVSQWEVDLEEAFVYAQRVHSQDEYGQKEQALREEFYQLIGSVIPVTTGWYYIVSAYPQFDAIQHRLMGMTANDEIALWGPLNRDNPYYLFRIEEVGEGLFSIENMGNNMFINYVDGDATQAAVAVTMSATYQTAQTFKLLGGAQFNIANVRNSRSYHCLTHGNGSGTGAAICPAQMGYNTQSAWYLEAVDDEKAASLIAQANMENLIIEVETVLPSASEAVFNAKGGGKALLTDPTQISANCTWETGDNTPDKALDGDYVSHFHSNAGEGYSLFTQDQWMQFDLGSDEVTEFILEFYGRDHASFHDTPNNIMIDASNTPDNDNSWEEIITLTQGFPGNVAKAHYVSPIVKMGKAYRYIRMHVKGTTSGNRYWNVSEAQVYDPTQAAQNSPYYVMEGVEEATNALEALMAQAQIDVNNRSVKEGQADELQAALNKLKDLLSVTDKAEAKVREAEAFFGKLFVYTLGEPIIQEVTPDMETTQLASNCTWIITSGDNYDVNEAQKAICDASNYLYALIDNNDQTYWHSEPNTMNWQSTPEYLHVDLRSTEYKELQMMIQRRNDWYEPQGTNRHGVMPLTLDVYGTNNDAQGKDINSSIDSWTKFATISGIPAGTTDGVWPYYASFSNPQGYRYLRFRPTSVEGGYGYWCMSEFNVFSTGIDQNQSQYYYVDGMKAAADHMMELAADLAEKAAANTAVLADINALDEALAAVKDLYQDADALNELVKQGETLIENTIVGTSFGELSDEQLLENLKTAVAAAKVGQSTSEGFLTVKQNLTNAINALLAGINKLDPAKWYYILNMAAENDIVPAEGYYNAPRAARGSALYVLSDGGADGKGDQPGNYHSEQQLRWGMDVIKNTVYDGDIDALWRFIPVDSLSYIGEDIYYIQSMRNGFYVGRSYDNSTAYDPHYFCSAKPYPFQLQFLGNGQYAIVAVSSNSVKANNPGGISVDNNAHQVHGGKYANPTMNSRAAWTFEEYVVDPDFPVLEVPYENNNIRVMTLPYAVSELAELNFDYKVHAYAIHSQPSDNELSLVEKTSFEAGEPFILQIGEPDNYADDHSLVYLMFYVPESVVDTANNESSNGIIGTLDKISLDAKAGFGYFSKAVLEVTTDEKKTTLQAQTGYIDPTRIETKDGAETKTILINGVMDGIKKMEVLDAKTKVNVYSIDGKLVKKNVTPAEAKKSLEKGVYVIGKQKVSVK